MQSTTIDQINRPERLKAKDRSVLMSSHSQATVNKTTGNAQRLRNYKNAGLRRKRHKTPSTDSIEVKTIPYSTSFAQFGGLQANQSSLHTTNYNLSAQITDLQKKESANKSKVAEAAEEFENLCNIYKWLKIQTKP